MPCANHPDVVTGLAACTRCGRDFCTDCVISLRGQTVCSACKSEVVQDVKSGTVDGDLDLASRGARFAAAFIDGLLYLLPLAVIMIPMIEEAAKHPVPVSSSPTMNFGWQNFVVPAIATCYEGLMLAKWGQTLGKMALKIKVVRSDGEPISAGQAWGRGLSRGLMAITQIVGFVDIVMIFSGPRTCLHDRFAKTKVVNWKR